MRKKSVDDMNVIELLGFADSLKKRSHHTLAALVDQHIQSGNVKELRKTMKLLEEDENDRNNSKVRGHQWND